MNNKNFNILHIYNYTPDLLGFSDEETVISEKETGINFALNKLNKESEFYSEILFFTKERRPKKIIADNLTFNFLPLSFKFLPEKISIGKHWRYFYNFGNQLSIPALKYIFKKNFDLIFLHIPNGLFSFSISFLKNFKKQKYCVWFRGGKSTGSCLKKYIFKNSVCNVFGHKNAGKEVKEFYELADIQIKIIPTGCNVNIFKPDTNIKKKNSNLKLLYIGRMDEQKGIDKLITGFSKAVKISNNINLKLIGKWSSNNLKIKINQMINEYNLKNIVSICEWMPRNELPKEYNSADLFVLPLQWREPGPVTLYESLACGTPVLVTECSDIAHTIIENNISGIITSKENFDNELLNLIQHPELIVNMRNNGREKVITGYSFETVLKRIKELYKTLLT